MLATGLIDCVSEHTLPVLFFYCLIPPFGSWGGFAETFAKIYELILGLGFRVQEPVTLHFWQSELEK